MERLSSGSNEFMSPEEREKYLTDKVQQAIQFAYENAPAVREKLDKAGIDPSQIRTVKDLEKIPVTSKEELRELQKATPPFGGFLTVPVSELSRIYISPGPIYDACEVEEARSLQTKAFSAAGYGKDDVVINTFTYHMVPAGLLLEEGLMGVGATVVPTGVGNTELQVQIMRDLGVTGYVGTPSFLMTLIKRAEEKGYNFRKDFRLRHAVLTAEMLPPSMRRTFEEEYGIDTVEIYGTADLGTLAYQCSQKSGMHIPEEIIVEIVDPNTGKQLGPGEVGEVVVTPCSKVYALVRFGTGDLSSFMEEHCPCGRTSPRLSRILGRVGDIIKVRGMFIHGKQIEEGMAKFPEVSTFQTVVRRVGYRDEMTLRVELTDEAIDREKLSDALGKSINEITRLKLDGIKFVAKGTIPEVHKIIVDERTWE